MKKLVAFLVLLYCSSAMAQIQKLGELSSGSFIDSAVIMEDDESDVFGYCLLYQLDRKSKEVFELEYVILDKNLNKLTSVTLTQAVFKSFMARTRAELTFAKKIGNRLTIGVNDRLVKLEAGDPLPFFNYRFIDVNLDNFKFSKEYKYENFTKKEFVYTTGDKVGFDDIWNLQKLISTKSEYFLSFASPEYNPKVAMVSSMEKFNFKKQESVKKFSILDANLKTVWSKNINTDKKATFQYGYLESDGAVLLLKKETLEKEQLRANNIEVYDIQKGTLISAIKLDDADYNMDLISASIVNDEIHIFTSAHDKTKKRTERGYGHLVFDKRTGTETSRNFILWKNLTKAIPAVSEYGVVDKEWLAAQDFIITQKGTTLMIIEQYIITSGYSPLRAPTAYANIGAMYLVEFNKEGEIIFSKKIEKKNSVEVYAGIREPEMRKYGVFDYIFCQKLDREGNFVFYYRMNDQVGKKKQVAKKPLWTLGIVSSVNNELGFEELPLYGNDLKIYPGLAKNGYIRLLEVNQKTNQAEMRLEKINY